MVEQARLAIGAEKGVERLYMRIDSLLKGRISGSVGRGIPKKLFPSDCVVFMVPFGAGGFGRHSRMFDGKFVCWER